MKNMKNARTGVLKIFIYALAAVLASTSLSGCNNNQTSQTAEFKKTTEDSYPLKTDATLTYWVPMSGHVSAHSKSLNETPLAKELIARTGIKVEFIHPPSGQENEKFNLMVSSGELPDIIESDWRRYPGGPDKAINEKVIEPLNQVLESVSPNFKKLLDGNSDMAKQLKTENGQNYVYPFILGGDILATYMGPMVRKDLLDKAGLPLPETVADWENTLRAFKGMGIEAPLVMTVDNTRLDQMAPFLSAFGVCGGFYVENDKIKFGPYEEKYKDFVKLMTGWYAEGLYDKNFMDTDGKRITALMAGGKGGAAFGSAGGNFGTWAPALKEAVKSGEFVPVKYPVMNKGETPKFGQKRTLYSTQGAAISGKSKNIELAARFLDYGYGNDGHMLYNFGVEGTSYTMVGNYPTYTDIITDDSKNGGLGIGAAMGKYIRACYDGPFVQRPEYVEQFYSQQIQKDALKVWPDTDTAKYQIPIIYLTEAENKEYTKIMQDIDTYRQEILYKTISGKSSLGEFDKYFAEMKDRGIEKAIKIQQDAYDRYKSR